jgi:hypothetical protein
MVMANTETDPVAAELADILPDLSHPSGHRVWLAGMAGDRLQRSRLICAEAIIGWLRKRSVDLDRCSLCGVTDGEVGRANASAADAWKNADSVMNELRAAKTRIAELESAQIQEPA